jgi:YD repeat-containing protein
MNDKYVRDGTGKIIGKWDGDWLRDGTGKLISRHDKWDGRTRTWKGEIAGPGDQRLRQLAKGEG